MRTALLLTVLLLTSWTALHALEGKPENTPASDSPHALPQQPMPPWPEDSRDQGLDQKPSFESRILFAAGEGGYESFRIPSIARAASGNLVAFAEGRVVYGDCSNNDAVYKVSTDDGKTWSPLKVLLSEGADRYGDPTQVLDRDTGRLWIFFNVVPDCSNLHNYITASMHSDDGGLTYTGYRTHGDVMPPVPEDPFGLIGPGNGIQVTYGGNIGRIIIPAARRMLYSDDHGVTFHAMKIRATGETTILDLLDGRLMKNDRSAGGKRLIAHSFDDGVTWTPYDTSHDLIDPTCQGSLIRFSTDKADRPRIAFLNCASSTARENLTVRLSFDEGKTWPVSRVVQAEKSKGYGSMARTRDNQLAILHETYTVFGKINNGQSLKFVKVNLPWIMDEQK